MYWVYRVYRTVLWCLAAHRCEGETSFRIGYGLEGEGRVVEANRYYPPPKKGERIGRFVGRVSFVRFHILVGPRYMSTCLRMGEVHADSVPLELM